MRRIFRNSKDELRLVWIWLIGIAVYCAINLGIGNLYKWVLYKVLPLEGTITTVTMVTADLLLQIPIIALTVIAFVALHRYLLEEPMRFRFRSLLIACGAALLAIAAAVLLLTAMGKLHIVRITEQWGYLPEEYALATAVYASLSLLATVASGIFRYGFLCGSVFKRLNRRAALLVCLLIFGMYSVLNSAEGIVWKVNGVLTMALILLALDLGGAGASCGVLLGMSVGLGVLFGSPDSAYTLTRIIPTSMEAIIAPTVNDPLTGGGAGAWCSLWLTIVLALLISIALLCHENVRSRLKKCICGGMV